jgi:anti-anti-sigma factor
VTDELATLTILPRADDDAVVVQVTGEIDLSNAGALTARMRDLLDTYGVMTVDLTALDYFDSAGVALVHDLAQHAKERSRELRLVAGEESNARRVLLLTRIDEILSVDLSATAT